MDQAISVVCVVAAVWASVVVLHILWEILTFTVRMLSDFLRPIECSALQFLQDRALARALGVDVDILRIRRKSQFPH